MARFFTWLACFIVIVNARELSFSDESSEENQCKHKSCVGDEYLCIEDRCYCAKNYVPDYQVNRCVRCPGLGERCRGPCCNPDGNGTLACWRGVCVSCPSDNHWPCRESVESILIVTTTQVAMATVLILGIIATFVLLYKLCTVTNLRSMGHTNSESRLSIGSLQLYVDERLRDAPPRYTRSAESTGSNAPVTLGYLNAGFMHDSSVPPPPYTPQKEENHNIATVHI